jgi:hypothetical protein
MNDLDEKLFKELFESDWGVVGVIVGMVGIFGGPLWGFSPAVTLAASLLLFTSFDIVGYNSVALSPNRMNLVRYRVIQTCFQWTLFLTVALITEWNLWATTGYVLLWWMGVCDVLFYILVGKLRDMLIYEDMPWLWWTPIGIINKFLGRQTSGEMVFIISLWTVIIWFGSLYLVENLGIETLKWLLY